MAVTMKQVRAALEQEEPNYDKAAKLVSVKLEYSHHCRACSRSIASAPAGPTRTGVVNWPGF